MINNTENQINELREKLYLRYDRKQLSKILKVSENHVSRLLNNQSELSLSKYLILLNLSNYEEDKKLYLKYDRNQLSRILKVSENHV